MALAKTAKTVAEIPFIWEGTDKLGRKLKGEMLAAGEAVVRQSLRRQGITASKVRKQGLFSQAKRISEKDIALFTRQLSTMVKAGVPLLQAFDITARSHSNPALQRLLGIIKADVESGSALNQAFRRHPKYFDALYCNLVEAGEQAGILETVLDRIASYKEKILAIKGKIKSALMYPAIVIVIAFIITAGIMLFVIPTFKQLYESSGAELPALTAMVIYISDLFVKWWWALVGLLIATVLLFGQAFRRSKVLRDRIDALSLKIPVFGPLIEKATVARWSRTFSSLFAAGVPMVDALASVAGASGNAVFEAATMKLRTDIATGASLTSSLQAAKIFPNMLIQMVSIGEESGSLDSMVEKVADYFEREVDDAVAGISSLMEPIIMVVLGTLIGTIVIAMYLPIFKMGSAF
ncbi:MAG: type II secretion system protein F [Hydrogenophilaceae bacterium CG1_02_62_390]|nr:MAG: type II secretion system protein F [Hydrogenophilaceae bacterium CG1_02_62_390]PIW38682.1 MAG: type II secretion system protein F [Hydrogenophilales bacterium CG15_BIG_FIL_POST_REV_8_21_14_020_62_31]PIW72286.1 MAG: type II secretion system protein F [Hydrogenophilales bacterium CG12_big_fil_rev_8_21_14_0_65_61_21]PIX01559.1 MAG: type II secretion system protein F [Hydrogenophilales bacterium CG_4_8_14_3_um_filter_62_83]